MLITCGLCHTRYLNLNNWSNPEKTIDNMIKIAPNYIISQVFERRLLLVFEHIINNNSFRLNASKIAFRYKSINTKLFVYVECALPVSSNIWHFFCFFEMLPTEMTPNCG